MLKKLSENKSQLFLATLILLSVALLLYNLGSYSLFDVDEPRYAEAAREMIESNNWITPYFNYVVRFEKPVFFYWLIASSYKIFGINEFAARLPSALMAMLIVFSTYFFLKKLSNSTYAFISSVIILTSFQFVALARMSITDMTLSAFICLMLMSGFTAIHTKGMEKKFYWYLFYIFMGLGALTKGPVVPVFSLLIFTPYLILTGKFKETFKSCELIGGSIVFLLVALPWYIMVILENGQPYIDQFFLTDNFKRFASTVSGHKGPIYYFIPVVALGFLPWSVFLPIFLLRYIKKLMNIFKSNKTEDLNKKHLIKNILNPFQTYFANASIHENLVLFGFLWFLLIFCFFSVSGTKLLTYLLPAFPAMALLAGSLFYDYIKNATNKDNKLFAYSFYCLTCAVVAVSLVIFYDMNKILPKDINTISIDHIEYKYPIIIGLLVLTILSMILNHLNKRILTFATVIFTVVFIICSTITFIIPVFNIAAQGTLKKIAYFTSNYPEKPIVTISFGVVKPSITYYSRKKIGFVSYEKPLELLPYINSNQRIFLITRTKFLKIIPQNTVTYFIFGDGRFTLLTNKPFDKIVTAKLLGKTYEHSINTTKHSNNY